MKIASKFRELAEEFRAVVVGRSKLVDSVVPPTVFVIVNATLGFEYAMWGSLALAVVFSVVRLARRQPLAYALGGLGGVVAAVLIARLLDRAEGYFLPSIITGILTVVLCGLSVVVRRPLVAWTSHLARGWPLEWYWHPKVRPAYSEVTLAWTVFFGLRLLLQLLLFRGERAAILAITNVLAGWPFTVALLAISYIYGTWRLRQLRGPSVEEFKAGAASPWQGQRRGF